MKTRRDRSLSAFLLLALVTLWMTPASAEAQSCDSTRLSGGAAVDGAAFGSSTSISGTLAAVGAPEDETAGISTGAVYLMRHDAMSGWAEEDRLAPSVQDPGARFGGGVSVSGDVVAVGAPNADASAVDGGAVYVYRFDGANWIEEQVLAPQALRGGDEFGFSVALSGGVLAVAAPGHQFGEGAVYVYRYDGNGWALETVLGVVGGPPSQGDRFGASLVLRPGLLVAGAAGRGQSGAAFLFRESAGAWPGEELFPSQATAGMDFGASVALDAQHVVVGAPGAGAAYLFWEATEIERYLAPNYGIYAPEGFGSGVAISGETLVVTTRESVEDDAVALLYTFFHAASNPTSRIGWAVDGAPGDGLGTSLALDGTRLLAGAPGDLPAGSVSAFELAEGTDCNGNGVDDACDLARGTVTDCNENGIPDTCDIASGFEQDCNGNGIPDDCDILSEASFDDDGDGIPDECCMTQYPGVLVANDPPTLEFTSEETYRTVVEDLTRRYEMMEDEDALEQFECALGFYSLRRYLSEGVAATRLNPRQTSRGPQTPDDHFIASRVLQTLLSPDLELKVGDAIYVVREHATYEITDGDLQTLELIRRGIEPESENVLVHGSGRGKKSGSSGCDGNHCCKKWTYYGDGTYRFQSKLWVHTIGLSSWAGASTKNQRFIGGKWKDSPADYIYVKGDGYVTDKKCKLVAFIEPFEDKVNKDKAKDSNSWFGIRKMSSFGSTHWVIDDGYECVQEMDLFGDCPYECDTPDEYGCIEEPLTQVKIRVKFSNGDGTYTATQEVQPDDPEILEHPILHGDVDNDGRTDLIFVGQGWDGPGLNIRVKRSNGDGTFTTWSQVMGDGAGVHTYPALTGDVDNDGRTDLIFIGQGWSGSGLNIRVKRSNGDGTWTSWAVVHGDGPGVHTHAALTGDVDNDDRTDLILIGQNWSGGGLNIRVKRSVGNGTWQHWPYIAGDGAGVHTNPAHMTDVDGDGDDDILFIGQNWSGVGLNIRAKLSNGDGTWSHVYQVHGDGAGVHTNPSLVGDVDGDGYPNDLILMGQGWSGPGLNMRGKPSYEDYTWGHAANILGDGAGVHTYAPLIGYFDDDEFSDVVFIGQGWSGAGLNIRTKFGGGVGSWTPTMDILPDGAVVHQRPAIAGDVDNDDLTDLIFVIEQ